MRHPMRQSIHPPMHAPHRAVSASSSMETTPTAVTSGRYSTLRVGWGVDADGTDDVIVAEGYW